MSVEKVSSNRYVEINSTYRNRIDYPKQASFIVEVGKPRNTGIDGLSARDPIIDGIPTSSFQQGSRNHSGVYAGGTPSRVKLDAGASILDGFYVGCIITTVINPGDANENQTSIIQSYNGNSQTALLYFPFNSSSNANGWNSGMSFTITDNSDFSHIYDPNGKNIDGYNVGMLLYNKDEDEFRTIVAYDALTQIYYLDSPFSNFSGQTFEVRKSKYINNGTSLAMTVNTLQLAVTASADNNIYVGQYVRFTSGALENQVKLITEYDGSTRTITFTPPVTVGPLPTYEILQYTRDNTGYIDYYGNGNRQEGLYEIELVDLILPNVTLKNDIGGRIAFYPYVYVEFTNTSMGTNNIISSNNPNSTSAVFRCPIVDTNSPLISTFVKIDSNFMRQVILFNPMNDIKFSVFLPDGSLFTTSEEDNPPPLHPNESLQISALFRITKT